MSNEAGKGGHNNSGVVTIIMQSLALFVPHDVLWHTRRRRGILMTVPLPCLTIIIDKSTIVDMIEAIDIIIIMVNLCSF